MTRCTGIFLFPINTYYNLGVYLLCGHHIQLIRYSIYVTNIMRTSKENFSLVHLACVIIITIDKNIRHVLVV